MRSRPREPDICHFNKSTNKNYPVIPNIADLMLYLGQRFVNFSVDTNIVNIRHETFLKIIIKKVLTRVVFLKKNSDVI